MVKIGVISDLHLGVRPYGLKEREEDFYEAYLKAINVFIDNNVDIVICGGDVFDQPRPSPKALEIFSNGIISLIDNGISFLNIVGNHAMIQSSDFVTADEFLSTAFKSDKYSILDDDNQYITDDLVVIGFPYYFNFGLDELIKKVNDANNTIKDIPSKTKILVLHQAFQEFCGFTGEKLSIDDIEVDNFDLIICGHIHSRILKELQSGTIFLQPGSLERLSVAEARDEEVNSKGIYIFDSDDVNINSISNSFISFEYPRKFLIADMYMKESNEVNRIENEILEFISDSSIAPILFLNVHDSSDSFSYLIDLTKRLKENCLTVNFRYFDESQKYINEIPLSESDIPQPREVLKIALNPLDEEEARFGIDLYDLLREGKDVQKILDDFLKKRIEKKEKRVCPIDVEKEKAEIEEYRKFFNNL